jgi:hypothetical protein
MTGITYWVMHMLLFKTPILRVELLSEIQFYVLTKRYILFTLLSPAHYLYVLMLILVAMQFEVA